jgi:hypothetical protein
MSNTVQDRYFYEAYGDDYVSAHCDYVNLLLRIDWNGDEVCTQALGSFGRGEASGTVRVGGRRVEVRATLSIGGRCTFDVDGNELPGRAVSPYGLAAIRLRMREREPGLWAGRFEGLPLEIAISYPYDDRSVTTMTCKHAASLRLGMFVRSATAPGASEHEDVPTVSDVHPRLDTALTLRAAEPVVARAILVESMSELLAALAIDSPELIIDDEMLSVRSFGGAEETAKTLVRLSKRLASARSEWEAVYETAIEPLWSRLAREADLTWDADRSRITGERYGAEITVRVTTRVGALGTRLRVKWPERPLTANLHFPASPDDPEGAEQALRPASMAAARRIASSGAAVTITSTGLEARLGRVADTDEIMEPLLRGTLALIESELGPQLPTGAYR